MITYVQARDAIVSHLSTNWPVAYPSVPVFYDNKESVDLDSVGDEFIRTELEFSDAEQASIGAAPITRAIGLFHLTIMTKEGVGIRGSLGYYDFLFALFKHKNLSGVQVGTPRPGHSETNAGWHRQELIVPFWFHLN